MLCLRKEERRKRCKYRDDSRVERRGSLRECKESNGHGVSQARNEPGRDHEEPSGSSFEIALQQVTVLMATYPAVGAGGRFVGLVISKPLKGHRSTRSCPC